jgi:hypothetical protein
MANDLAKKVADGYRAGIVTAMEHPSEEARKDYLKEHPRADPNNHRVKKKVDESKAPADKKDLDAASKAVKSVGSWIEEELKNAQKGGDEHHQVGEGLSQWMGNYKKHVEKLYDGVTAIPKGKERDRAKKLVTQINGVFEKLNDDLGYRWEGKRWVTPHKAEDTLKKAKPLIEELDKLLTGQRTLFASVERVARRFVAAEVGVSPSEMHRHEREARTMGAKAFQLGVEKPAPALDKAINDLMKAHPFSLKQKIALMKAWQAGWVKANLDAPISDE